MNSTGIVRTIANSKPEDDKNSRIQMLFIGDLCTYGRRTLSSCKAGSSQKIITKIHHEIIGNDVIVANLECPLTNADSGIDKIGPHLKADPITVEFLKKCPIHVANLSNNHIMDYGERGLKDTLETLVGNGIKHVGAGKNLREAAKPLIMTVQNTRIAFLSFCETEYNLADDYRAGCAPMDMRLMVAAIKEAKDISDTVICSLHCGSEHFPLPSPRIKSVCRAIADSGVSLVVCHHTHIISGFEIHNGVPIAYGLGNFLFDDPENQFPPHWYQGCMLHAAFHSGKIVEFKLIPYTFDYETGRFLDSSLCDVGEFEQRINFLSKIITNDKQLQDIWEQYALRQYIDWYLPILTKNAFNIWKPKAQRDSLFWHYRSNESHSEIINTALNLLRNKYQYNKYYANTVLKGVVNQFSISQKIKNKIRGYLRCFI